MTTAAAQSFVYARGEEVLAHPPRTGVFSIEGAARLGRACVPQWTIAVVLATACNGRGRNAYLLSFEHDGGACFCWVDERAIEGVC